ncbi:MAG TPA: Gfo/Idh/MocA family oxidoreductase [Cyclobacteriaceae bacterium]|nr:Gfo/Idh/MocA family oxidoreductase [Cyclobacteriaceae bacterium]
MKTDRRGFIRTSSLALAGAGLASGVSFESCAAPGTGANGIINIGAIGINGMGWSNLNSMLKVPNTRVVAICDVDENVLARRKEELSKKGISVTTYIDYRKLLENKDIDVVIIGSPDHWHCLQMVDACAAGKDVYVEKPVGNSIEECNAMVAAQVRYNRVVQCGQWQRSVTHFSDAMNFLHSGQLGKIRTVKAWAYQGWMTNIEQKPDGSVPAGVHYDMWLGPATMRPFNPNRFHFNFRWFWDYAGGLMTDWGVHCIDYALLGMNSKFPKSAVALGGKYAYPDGAHETPDTLAVVYDFGDYNMIWEHAQSIDNGPYGRNHGISYIGNNGTLVLDRGGWEVIPDSKRMEAVPLQAVKGNGHDVHTANFIDVVRSRKLAELRCSIQEGAHTAIVCQMGNISYKSGDKVSWNEAAGQFNEAKANPFIKATYHNGYQVPK